jgi:hypothetical protein
MGAKSRVGPRVQIERSLKNDVLALVLHTAVVVRRKGTAPGAGSRDTKVPIQYVSSPVKLLLCSLPMLWHPIRSSKVSDLFKHPWNLHELTSTEAILVPRRLKPKY